VGEIRSNAGGVDNIVEGELVDDGAGLAEKGERLADSSGGTEHYSIVRMCPRG
jgi:hypothetical protein